MADGSAAPVMRQFTNRPFEAAERELACAEICERLAQGEPLAAICREPGTPSLVTVWSWAESDQSLAEAIARARLAGFDRIATDALLIVDGKLPLPGQQADVQRDKLRFEGRLRLLAKWDPKRYGEAMQMRLADADGQKLDTGPMVRELMALMRPQDGADAQVIEGAATVVAPAAKSPPAGR